MDTSKKDNLRLFLQDKVLKRFSVLWGDIGYEDTKLKVLVEFSVDLDEIVDRSMEIFMDCEVGRQYAEEVRKLEIQEIEKGDDDPL